MRTSEFLTALKRGLMIPTYQTRLSDEDILQLASSAQTSDVMPALRALRQDFFLTYDDVTLVTGESSIQIPARAVGRAVRDIWVTTDSTYSLENCSKLVRIDPNDLLQIKSNTGNTYGYYYEHDTLKLVPAVPETTYIRIWYMYRPNDLVKVDETCEIVSIGTTTLTVDKVPANIVSGSKIDVVAVNPGYQTLLKDLVVASKSATTIVVSGYDFSAQNISVGDIVSTARKTSVVQLPEDCHDYLQWKTSVDVAISLGIPEMVTMATKRSQESLVAMRDAMTPRNDEGEKIYDPNGLFRTSNIHRAWAALTR